MDPTTLLLTLAASIFLALLIIITLLLYGLTRGASASVTQLGPYRNLSLLSDKGGMSKVYYAYNAEAGRECVLKVLRSEMLGDADTVKKFQRESEILREIRRTHPDAPVVGAYASGTISTQLADLPFVELEYIPGRMDLADYLRQHGKLSPELCEKVVAQLARALTAAHETGAIHRDLKPGNVLLYEGDPNRLAVCDFGVAKRVDSKSVTVGGYGTAAYMSPEQCGAKGGVSAATDVYALGLVWFELLAGERLFDSDNPMLLMRSQESEAPASRLAEKTPEPYREILGRMLAKAPESRPTLEEILASLKSEALATPGYQGEKHEARTIRYRGEYGQGGRRAAVGALSLLLVGLLTALGVELNNRWEFLAIANPPERIALAPTEIPAPLPTAIPAPVVAIPPETPPSEGRLYIKPIPAEAEIRLLNYGPRYEEGMTLPAGRYDVEASYAGFETWREWVEVVAGEDMVLAPELNLISSDNHTPPAPTQTPTPPPPSVSENFTYQSQLNASSAISVRRSDRYADAWRFTLDRRTGIVIDQMSPDIDCYLILYRGGEPSRGNMILEDDDGGTNSNARLARTLDAGVYSIEATTFGQRVSGAYTLRSNVALSNLASPPPAIEESSERKTVALPGGVVLELAWIPPGRFIMGSPVDEQDRHGDGREGPQRRVTISRGFWMGKYPVTQAQWRALMGANPSRFQGNNLPVENVTWDDCQAFIQRLNELGQGRFSLPTEAQWEYAARAGTTTRFYWGDDLNYAQIGDYAWHKANAGERTHPVGQKRPNAWGLYDMSGNVWEWCQDWVASAYPDHDEVDPQGPQSGMDRVTRGGSWNFDNEFLRSARRSASLPTNAWDDLGFRIVSIQTP